MTHPWSPSRAAWLVWAAAGAICAGFLVVRSVSLPGDDLGVRRFNTPPISSTLQYSQTFRMPARGLRAVEFSAVAVGEVSGSVRLSLVDITRGQGDVVRIAEVPAEDLVRHSRYRFEFPPIPDSNEHGYRLELSSVESSPAGGVALRATKGERYEGGTLLVNGDVRWADLAFETDARGPRVGRLLLDWTPRDGWRRPLVFAAPIAAWLALGLALQGLVVIFRRIA